MATAAVWKKIVTSDVGPFRSFKAIYQLDPTWPGEPPYWLGDVPAGWLWGRNRHGTVFACPPNAPPIPLSVLVKRKVWR